MKLHGRAEGDEGGTRASRAHKDSLHQILKRLPIFWVNSGIMYICEEGGPREAEPRPASSLFLLALLNIIMHGRRGGEKHTERGEQEGGLGSAGELRHSSQFKYPPPPLDR